MPSANLTLLLAMLVFKEFTIGMIVGGQVVYKGIVKTLKGRGVVFKQLKSEKNCYSNKKSKKLINNLFYKHLSRVFPIFIVFL